MIAWSRAKGSVTILSWDESVYEEGPHKLTLAVVTQEFSGDISGDGSVRWLMAYRDDGTARFVGFQLVDGAIAGRDGSFVLETAGDFDGTVARWTATIIGESGSGKLAGIEGSGVFGAEHGPEAKYELDYRIL